MTLTPAQRVAIEKRVFDHELPVGLGSEEAACTVASINLALTGTLTDEIPACMSVVIGRWIIGVQDAMPAAMRNSFEWKKLIPDAAGTGREREREHARLQLIMEWMWGTVLPVVQPVADARGFGEQWRRMTTEKTATAAAYAGAAAANAANAAATYAANAAATAANINAIYAAYAGATAAATAATYAAYAAYAGAAGAWDQFDPCGLLLELINA